MMKMGKRESKSWMGPYWKTWNAFGIVLGVGCWCCFSREISRWDELSFQHFYRINLQIQCKYQVINSWLKTFIGCEGSSHQDIFILF